MTKDEVTRLLLGNGFKLVGVEPKPNYHLFTVEQVDLLGARVRTSIAVGGQYLVTSDISRLEKIAVEQTRRIILVTQASMQSVLPWLTYDQFRDRLGGSILSLLPLNPAYGERLKDLGINSLSDGLAGDANTLFEEYVHAGLQYLFGARVVKYGQDRAFEKVPDGLVIDQSVPVILYDAKAYGAGYEVNSDSIRQFGTYIRDYNRRYATLAGKAYGFLVISGKFVNGKQSKQQRSDELAADYDARLSFLTAGDMAEIVQIATQNPSLRKSVHWKRLLISSELKAREVRREFEARNKDGIV